MMAMIGAPIVNILDRIWASQVQWAAFPIQRNPTMLKDPVLKEDLSNRI